MDIETLRSLLEYDPLTGVLTWKVRAARRIQVGDQAGYSNKKNGRVTVRIERRIFTKARVVWAIAHGRWPSGEIDHINGDPSDDRLENLRDVSHSYNMQNIRHAKGVRLRAGKWEARIMVAGKDVYLGRYLTEAEAKAARRAARLTMHAGCIEP